MNVTRGDIARPPKERRPGAIGQRPDERALFEQTLESGVQDRGRALDPTNDRLFTWWPPWRSMRQKNQGWRLDYVLVSHSLKTSECRVQADVGTSDHAPVVAVIDPPLPPAHPGVANDVLK